MEAVTGIPERHTKNVLKLYENKDKWILED